MISTAPAVFRRQMGRLAACGVPVVPLGEVHRTPGAVALTFDDGFRNFVTQAAPVLESYRFPATVFAVSGYCGKRNDWPSQTQGNIPSLDLMDWRELRSVASSRIAIGAHTVTHPWLSRLPEREVEQELRICQAEIEHRMGCKADTFAYPYGDWNAAVARMAAPHFRIACTTTLAPVIGGSDLLAVPRIDAYYLRTDFWFRNFRSGLGQGYLGGRRFLRFFKSRLSTRFEAALSEEAAGPGDFPAPDR